MDKTTKKMDIGNLINQAWELTKKHFPVFLLLTILAYIISGILQYAYYGPYIEMVMESGTTITEEEWMSMMLADGEAWSWVAKISLIGIFVFLANNY